MHINQYLNTYGDYLKRRFGQRVQKLSLSGNFTCPNRDGTLGRGGCTFCNISSFSGEGKESLSISEQLAQAPEKRSKIFLAYFQAYTSTYAELQLLKRMYSEALEHPNIVGICVGTRPDCVSDEVLDLLERYQDEGKEVWLELGLQSAIDETLDLINRHHHFSQYADTVNRARSRGIKVCAHLIIGLPGEELIHNLTTLQMVIDEGVDALKLHQLHIVKGSAMAAMYRRGEISVLELDEYAEIAARLIQYTPPEIMYERIGASVQDASLIAPMWSTQRWPCIDKIGEILAEKGGQGTAIGRPYIYDGISRG